MTAEPKLPGSRRPWVRPLLSGLAILLCGVLIGGALTSLVLWDRLSNQMKHPRLDPIHAAMRISDSYDLDADRHRRLQEIFDAHVGRFEEIRLSVTPTLDSLTINFRDEVAAILEPGQREKWLAEFDDNLRRFKKRVRGPFRRPPPEPGSEPGPGPEPR